MCRTIEKKCFQVLHRVDHEATRKASSRHVENYYNAPAFMWFPCRFPSWAYLKAPLLATGICSYGSSTIILLSDNLCVRLPTICSYVLYETLQHGKIKITTAVASGSKQSASMHGSTAAAAHSIRTRHITRNTLHHLEQLVATLQLHAYNRKSSVAPASTLRCNSQQQQKQAVQLQ